jgi:hypothetical protein
MHRVTAKRCNELPRRGSRRCVRVPPREPILRIPNCAAHRSGRGRDHPEGAELPDDETWRWQRAVVRPRRHPGRMMPRPPPLRHSDC